ncbi:YbjN domain-containing protein [Ectothiorhodospira shaposhnikovii]|uniref:YbjN domain-containing protein n=1 Tax=Ectothiorhodospira shaposhnikovii TaxID=1054 RepID=UPI001EE8046C|nr:YbjN domain-containing protein [Ectothiorhodospira shaposhnikovii]MCG5513194.1 YbjN domain-containing protein [Ectothiorhodospira shaposhnikovii]
MLKPVLMSAVLLAATGTLSAAEIVDAKDPEKIRQLAQGYGSATLTTDSVGDPMIRGRIDGTGYTIMFYGCSQNLNCKNIQFTSAWQTNGQYTLEDMNQWNRVARFGKAYLDDEGDPVLEMNVNLDFGVTARNLDDTLDWWRVALLKFRSEVLTK